MSSYLFLAKSNFRYVLNNIICSDALLFSRKALCRTNPPSTTPDTISPKASMIRPAKADDAYNLAKLIDIAGEGIPNWLWSMSADESNTALDIGAGRAQRTSGGFSFTNAHLAEVNGAVGGMLLGYPIIDVPDDNSNDVPPPIVPFVELEKHYTGTWYINALAVFAEARGNGVGTNLMKQVELKARAVGLSKMSIQVYAQNRGAVRLYKRLGYQFAASAPVQDHPCQPYYTGDVLLLTKEI